MRRRFVLNLLLGLICFVPGVFYLSYETSREKVLTLDRARDRQQQLTRNLVLTTNREQLIGDFLKTFIAFASENWDNSPLIEQKTTELRRKFNPTGNTDSRLVFYLYDQDLRLNPALEEKTPDRRVFRELAEILQTPIPKGAEERERWRREVNGFANKGSVNFIFGEKTKPDFTKIHLSPSTFFPLDYKQRGYHSIFWSPILPHEVGPAVQTPGAVKVTAKNHGILIAIINWRAMDWDFFKTMPGDLLKCPQNMDVHLIGESEIGMKLVYPPQTADFFDELPPERIKFLFTLRSWYTPTHINTLVPIDYSVKTWHYDTPIYYGKLEPGDENLAHFQDRNRAPKLLLLVRQPIEGIVTELNEGFRSSLLYILLLSLAIVSVFDYIQCRTFISIQTKLQIFILLFFGLPALLYFYNQFQNIKQSFFDRCQAKKEELLGRIRADYANFDEVPGFFLSIYRNLRDSQEWDQIGRGEKSVLLEFLRRVGNPYIKEIFVWDKNQTSIFGFSQGKEGSQNVELASQFADYVLPLVTNKSDPSKDFTLGIIRALVPLFTGEDIFLSMAKLDRLNLFLSNKLVLAQYTDVKYDSEGGIRFIFFAISALDHYISDLLRDKCRLLNPANERGYNYGIFDSEAGTIFPAGRGHRWRDRFIELDQIKHTGPLENNFDPNFLLATYFDDFFKKFYFAYYPKNMIKEEIRGEQKKIIALLIFLLLLMIVLARFFSYQILTPLEKLKSAMRAVEEENFDHQMDIRTGDEIESLATTFNKMLTGMAEKKRLAIDKAELKFAFGRFLSPEIVDQIANDPSQLQLGGQTSYITAFFSDIAGFSGIAEKMAPAMLVEFLNQYLTEMTDILLEANGTLDKYEGDAIIAFFGAPITNPRHRHSAMSVALAMQNRLVALRSRWMGEGEKWPPAVQSLRIRIGINSGQILTGNMGSRNRMNYTMMGDAVNLASRLESAAKFYGVGILVSEETLRDHREDFIHREIDTIRVVGKSEPTRVYELLDLPENRIRWEELLGFYTPGLELFQGGKYREALEKFEIARNFEADAETSPSAVYRYRCLTFIEHPDEIPEELIFDLKQK